MTKIVWKKLDTNKLETMQKGELENLHSEMLATCTDIGYEPPESACVEIGDDLDAAREMLAGLHNAIGEFLERNPEGVKKPLAEDGEKTDTGSAGKSAPKSTKKSAKKAGKAPAADSKKETTVAKTAKKIAKKAAKKTSKKSGGNGKFDEAKTITWILPEDKGLGVRAGSGREERRKMLKRYSGKTVGAFIKAGGKQSSLSSAVAEKVVRVA